MINNFPPKSGISHTYSLRTIIMGNQMKFKNQCRWSFGAYVQAHDDRNVTNQMIDWTQGAICLGQTGNLQGSYAFLSLHNGRKIARSQLTEMPTPPHATQRVIAISMHENQKKGLVFEDHNGV